jgi:hypothetical protein
MGMTDIHKITIQLQRPRGNYEGRTETGYYVVNDGTVTLVEENGVPVDRYKLTRKLEPGADARATACALLRQRYSKGGSGDFNRKLIYPKVVF